MSCQKGNANRVRSQKHQNRTAFKNNLHDTSNRTKLINNIQVSDVCARCKEIIEWKIKYKKYKPLTQPKKCVKCFNKSVTKAYHVMCRECGKRLGLCAKCCQSKQVIAEKITETEQVKLDNEMKNLLQSLSERKRRTFIRYMSKINNGTMPEGDEDSEETTRTLLMKKLTALESEADINSELNDDNSDDSSCDFEY